MPGLPFPPSATPRALDSSSDDAQADEKRELLIDPALQQQCEPVIDPLLYQGPTSATSECSPDTVSLPLEHNYIPPSDAFSPGPQGDPFAPQPADYFPVVHTSPRAPQPKAQNKRKKKPARETKCGFCHGDDTKNKYGAPERMASCSNCGRSAHPICMDLGHMAETIHEYAWRCTECTTCEVCSSAEEEKMLICDSCDRGWHMYCMQPQFEESPPGKWFCPTCTGMPAGQCIEPEAEMQTATNEESILAASASDQPDLESGLRESSVASSSRAPALPERRAARSRRKTAKAAELDVDNGATLDGPETPVPRTRNASSLASASVRKSVRKRIRDGGSPSPTPKRPRLKIAVPQVAPQKRVVLKISAKGKERAESPDEEVAQDIFEDILDDQDRDITRTIITSNDKARFERSRSAAELKSMPLKPSVTEPVASTSGPSSRPLRSSTITHTPVIALSARSESPATSTPGPISARPAGPRIRTIRFGPYDIQTWYDAPFPEEYSSIPDGRLWLCEFCLKYMKSEFTASRHRLKCKVRHPPGDEIYRDGNISIYEVDGRRNKIYCQNLCLLSKMFLDHKSLFYDVEPFLFYVMTEIDDMGAQFVGYFSKEKRSPKDYNVSCIMTLPVRQRKGWGNLLIDFSYLLSRKEQRVGSPEKPLSGLGALGYKNYWTLAVMRYLRTAPKNPDLEDICRATSMTMEDTCNTLEQLGLISTDASSPAAPKLFPGQSVKYSRTRRNGVARRHLVRTQTQDDETSRPPFIPPAHYEIHWDQDVVADFMTRWEAKGYSSAKPEKLRWSPFIVARVKKSDGVDFISDGPPSVPDVEATEASPSLNTSSLPDVVRSPSAPLSSTPSVPPLAPRRRLRSPTKPLDLTPTRRLRSQGFVDALPLHDQARRSTSPAKTPASEYRELRRSGRKGVKGTHLSNGEPVSDDTDAALAIQLAQEERRTARSLRSRSASSRARPLSPDILRSTILLTRVPSRKRRRIDSSPEPESEQETLTDAKAVEGSISTAAVCVEAINHEGKLGHPPTDADTGRHSAPSDDTVFVDEAGTQTILAKDSPSDAIAALSLSKALTRSLTLTRGQPDPLCPSTTTSCSFNGGAEGEDEDAEGDTDEEYAT